MKFNTLNPIPEMPPLEQTHRTYQEDINRV